MLTLPQRSLTDATLELFSFNQGKISGRSKLQKLVYLLKKVGLSDFANVYFHYDIYGPYSRELSAALQEVIAVGFVIEIVEDASDPDQGLAYTYCLTESGVKRVAQNQSGQNSCLQRVMRLFNRLPDDTLELSSTVLFLVSHKHSKNVDEACRLVVQQRPILENKVYKVQRLLKAMPVIERVITAGNLQSTKQNRHHTDKSPAISIPVEIFKS